VAFSSPWITIPTRCETTSATGASRWEACVAGFLSWDADERDELGWRTDPGFLMGAAGIGLALLSAATATVPAWDRVLLVS